MSTLLYNLSTCAVKISTQARLLPRSVARDLSRRAVKPIDTQTRPPKVQMLDADGETYCVKTYPLLSVQELSYFLRYAWLNRQLEQQGLRVPRILSLRVQAGLPYPAVVAIEDLAPGRSRTSGELTPDNARRLAQDLHRWHTLEDKTATSRRFLYRMHPGAARQYASNDSVLRRYRRRIPDSFADMPLYDAEYQQACRRYRSLFNDSDFIHRLVISHGDLNSGNMIWDDDGSLTWIDYENFSRRCMFHDVADIIFVLLRKSPQAMDEFERAYFAQTEPATLALWRTHRLNWLGVINCIRAHTRLYGPQPSRIHRENRSDSQRLKLGIPALSRARAAHLTRDRGEPSSELLQRVRKRAKKIKRELIHHHGLDLGKRDGSRSMQRSNTAARRRKPASENS